MHVMPAIRPACPLPSDAHAVVVLLLQAALAAAQQRAEQVCAALRKECSYQDMAGMPWGGSRHGTKQAYCGKGGW